MEEINKISQPRLLGSEGEIQTLDYLESRLKDFGISPKREEFKFSIMPIRIGFPLAPVIATGLTFAAIWVITVNPILSAVLSTLTLAFIPVASRWSRFAEKLFDLPMKRRASNLIGEIGSGKAEKRIIFTAHYDSKSQTLPIGLRIVGSILSVPVAAIIALLCLSMSISSVVLSITPLWMVETAFWLQLASCLPFGVAIILLFNGTRNRSPGALDNASGCVVLLDIARRLSKSPPQNTNITIIFTGAEEFGLAGAIRYAQKYADELDPANTTVVNVDSVGYGSGIGIVDRYGILPVRTSKHLSKSIAGRVEGIKRIYIPIGVGLDMFPFALRKCDSISFTASAIRTLFVIHTASDTPERLDSDALARTVDYCIEVVNIIENK
jgi:hypothetical protein